MAFRGRLYSCTVVLTVVFCLTQEKPRWTPTSIGVFSFQASTFRVKDSLVKNLSVKSLFLGFCTVSIIAPKN